MAKKKKEETPSEEATAEGQPGPMLQILAQYTKDQSFENPNAPDSLRSEKGAPAINIGIEIGRQMMADDAVEVTLILKADAKHDDQTAFIAELEYAGLFAFRNVNIEEVGNAAMFLLSPWASGITGEILFVDAGFNTVALSEQVMMQVED